MYVIKVDVKIDIRFLFFFLPLRIDSSKVCLTNILTLCTRFEIISREYVFSRDSFAISSTRETRLYS